MLYKNQWWPAQWLYREEAPKHFQSQTCTKKGHSHWWSAAGLLPTAFWILVKPLHLRSMLSKSMRCTKNCNACSQHWSTERVQFFSATTPDCTLHNQHFKSWMNWAAKFYLICYIHLTSRQLTTAFLSILTIFCRENAFTTAESRKCFPRVCEIAKHGILC